MTKQEKKYLGYYIFRTVFVVTIVALGWILILSMDKELVNLLTQVPTLMQIALIVGTLLVIGIYVGELVDMINKLKIGKTQLFQFVSQNNWQDVTGTKIYEGVQKDSVMRSSVYIVLGENDERNIVFLKDQLFKPGDKTIQKRYRFYQKDQYILAVDDVIPTDEFFLFQKG